MSPARWPDTRVPLVPTAPDRVQELAENPSRLLSRVVHLSLWQGGILNPIVRRTDGMLKPFCTCSNAVFDLVYKIIQEPVQLARSGDQGRD